VECYHGPFGQKALRYGGLVESVISRGSGRALHRCRGGPLAPAGSPVPGPDGGLGNNGGDSGHHPDVPEGTTPSRMDRKTTRRSNRSPL
jgi:hypothetical protein